MTVNAAGPGPSSPNAAIALLPLPSAPASSAPAPSAPDSGPDRAISVLLEFSHPAVQAAIQLPDHHGSVDILIHRAVQAIAQNDIPRALHAIGEILHKQPDADLRVLHEPSLAPIHDRVRELVDRVSHLARTEAVKTLAAAAPLAASPRMPPETPAVLALANRFIETGQFINYIRAHQLGGLVISWSQIPGSEDHVEQTIARTINRIAGLWRRAPLLVLLIAWFLLGIVLLPFDPELWGAGFLALVAVQFLITIRNWPRRL